MMIPKDVGRNKPARRQQGWSVSGNRSAGNASSCYRSNRLIPAYV